VHGQEVALATAAAEIVDIALAPDAGAVAAELAELDVVDVAAAPRLNTNMNSCWAR